MSKKMLLVGLLSALIVFPGLVYGAIYTVTDATSGVGNGTVYTFDTTAGTLTAETNTNDGWGIGFWSLNVNDDSFTASASTGVPLPGTWDYANGGTANVVDLYGANNWPQNHWDGAYTTTVIDPTGDYSGIAILNGTTYVWNFNTANLTEGSSFQVGYFNPESSATPRLSQTTQVPEPGSLLLLGTGLIGLAGFGRKKYKM